MSIYKKLSKMGGDMSIDEKLYLLLNTEKYQDGLYKTCHHGGIWLLYIRLSGDGGNLVLC